MKIFYAVQATGNGHISRAMTLLPHLQRYGTVDIFLSGNNSNLQPDLPIKYRSKGVSLFYNSKGGLDYWQLIKKIQPLRIIQEIRDLPVEKYDMVLNDFDYITSAACARKKIPSIHFGHQASFHSSFTPRPVKKSFHGEILLKHYVKATHYSGFHFESYDDFIFSPVIKNEILEAVPYDKQHITVYLPSYCDLQLRNIFMNIPEYRFEIFSRESSAIRTEKNISFIPVNKDSFNRSLITCTGIICGAGFETPAEALHLGKKIIAIPIAGQYEQQCNAAALEQLGVLCLKSIDKNFNNHFNNWIGTPGSIKKDYSKSIIQSLEYLFSLPAKKYREEEIIMGEFC
ncbi:MAG: glycosyltransferase family protein [Chitinophagaceae bacterium]